MAINKIEANYGGNPGYNDTYRDQNIGSETERNGIKKFQNLEEYDPSPGASAATSKHSNSTKAGLNLRKDESKKSFGSNNNGPSMTNGLRFTPYKNTNATPSFNGMKRVPSTVSNLSRNLSRKFSNDNFQMQNGFSSGGANGMRREVSRTTIGRRIGNPNPNTSGDQGTFFNGNQMRANPQVTRFRIQ
jgi:hypothetical protein